MNEEKQNTGTGERIRIGNSCLTVEICLRGAELYAVRPAEGGDSYLWSGDPSIWSGRAPILFPICGALREDTYMHEGVQYRMDKHGFASGMRFEAVETGREHAVLRLEDSETTRAMYPFSFALTVRYALAERTLEVTYAVENRGGEPLYYSIGAHEGFALPEGVRAYEVHFDEREDMTAADLAGPYLAGTHRRILPEDGRVLPLDPEQFVPDALIFLFARSFAVPQGRDTGGARGIPGFSAPAAVAGQRRSVSVCGALEWIAGLYGQQRYFVGKAVDYGAGAPRDASVPAPPDFRRAADHVTPVCSDASYPFPTVGMALPVRVSVATSLCFLLRVENV